LKAPSLHRSQVEDPAERSLVSGHGARCDPSGRGGASYSGFHTPLQTGGGPIVSREHVTLEYAKFSGERFEDTVLNLNLETR
jgi:hypothetical protein